jgi:hypothetical protein
MGRFENRRFDRERPPRWSIGEAVGTALQGGGQFFGALAVEKQKSENLVAARAERQAEKAADRVVALGDRDEARGYKARLLTESLDRDTAASTAKAATDEAERDSNVARNAPIQGSDLISQMGEGAPENLDPSQVYRVNFNGEGSILNIEGKDTDYTVNDDGQTVKYSAQGKSAKGGKNPLNEGTRKGFILAPQGLDAVSAYAEVMGIDLKTGKASGDASVSSLRGAVDEWLGEGRFTNVAVGGDGQRSNLAQQNMMVIIRNFISGAAFTADETPVYLAAYVPRSTDTSEVKVMKLLAYRQLMTRLGDTNLNTEEGQEQARQAATEGLVELQQLRFEMFKDEPADSQEHDAADAGLNGKFGNKYMNSTD